MSVRVRISCLSTRPFSGEQRGETSEPIAAVLQQWHDLCEAHPLLRCQFSYNQILPGADFIYVFDNHPAIAQIYTSQWVFYEGSDPVVAAHFREHYYPRAASLSKWAAAPEAWLSRLAEKRLAFLERLYKNW